MLVTKEEHHLTIVDKHLKMKKITLHIYLHLDYGKRRAKNILCCMVSRWIHLAD